MRQHIHLSSVFYLFQLLILFHPSLVESLDCPANFTTIQELDISSCEGTAPDPTICCKAASNLEEKLLASSYMNGTSDVQSITTKKDINQECHARFQSHLETQNVSVDIFQYCARTPFLPLMSELLANNTCAMLASKASLDYTSLEQACANEKACLQQPGNLTSCYAQILAAAFQLKPQDDRQLQDCYEAVGLQIAQAAYASVYLNVFANCSDQVISLPTLAGQMGPAVSPAMPPKAARSDSLTEAPARSMAIAPAASPAAAPHAFVGQMGAAIFPAMPPSAGSSDSQMEASGRPTAMAPAASPADAPNAGPKHVVKSAPHRLAMDHFFGVISLLMPIILAIAIL